MRQFDLTSRIKVTRPQWDNSYYQVSCHQVVKKDSVGIPLL